MKNEIITNVNKIGKAGEIISNIAKELCQTLGKCSFQRQAIDSNTSDYQGKKNIVGGRSVVEGWSIPQHRTPDKSLLLRNITITGGRWSKKQHIAHAHTRVNITRKMRATGILWLLYQTFQEIPEHQDCKRIPEATDVAQRCSRRKILTGTLQTHSGISDPQRSYDGLYLW